MGYEWTTVFWIASSRYHRKWPVVTEESERFTSSSGFIKSNLLFSTFGKFQKSQAPAYQYIGEVIGGLIDYQSKKYSD